MEELIKVTHSYWPDGTVVNYNGAGMPKPVVLGYWEYIDKQKKQYLASLGTKSKKK